MMKLSKLFFCGALFGCASQMFADNLVWEDEVIAPGGYIYLSENGVTSFTGTFDIRSDGFLPNLMTVTSASASFAFADDAWGSDTTKLRNGGDNYEYIDVTVDLTEIFNHVEVDGDWSNAPTSYDWVSTNLDGYASLMASLNEDGQLSFTVTLENYDYNTYYKRLEDVYFKRATLHAEGTLKNSNVSVPDGAGTGLLLTSVLLGFACFHRRRV